MKKKILTILLVLLLVIAVAMSVVACNKKNKTPDNGDGSGTGDGTGDGDGGDEVTVDPADIFSSFVSGLDATLGKLGTVSTGATFGATIYAKVGTTVDLEFSVKGSFDKTDVSKNSGYIEVKNAGDVICAIVVDKDSTVYIGETMTQKANGTTLNWFKLSQAEGVNFVKDYFSMIPELIAANATELGSGSFIQTAGGSILPMVSAMSGSLFSATTSPAAFDSEAFNEDGTIADGDYTMTVNGTGLVNLLNMKLVKDIINGEAVKEMLTSYKDILNPVLQTILGVSLVEEDDAYSFSASGVTPTIKISATAASNALTAVGISYTKPATAEDAAVDVSFGIKNVVINSAATADTLKPSYMPATVKDAVLKVSLDISSETKDLAGHLDVYVSPEISLSFDENDVFHYTFEDASAYAVATFNGVTEKMKASYLCEEKMLAVDFGAFYKAIGIDAAAEGFATVYKFEFDLNGMLGGEVKETADNAEGDEPTNLIDKIIADVEELMGGDFALDGIIGLVTEYMGDVLDLGEEISAAFEGFGTADKDAGTFTFTLADFVETVAGIDTLQDSEFIKGFLGDYIDDALLKDGKFDGDKFVEILAGYIGIEKDDINANIAKYINAAVGTDKTGAEIVNYLANLSIKLTGNMSPEDGKGFGFAIAISDADDTVIDMSLAIDFETVDSYKFADNKVATTDTTPVGFTAEDGISDDWLAIWLAISSKFLPAAE